MCGVQLLLQGGPLRIYCSQLLRRRLAGLGGAGHLIQLVRDLHPGDTHERADHVTEFRVVKLQRVSHPCVGLKEVPRCMQLARIQ